MEVLKSRCFHLESLACVNADCEQYGQSGQHNLIIRKIYGEDQIRYLRCRGCEQESSERKLTHITEHDIIFDQAVVDSVRGRVLKDGLKT